jgi:hypothetical protein
MVQINFARREVNCKIVYYGPGLSGKTTNLEIIHKKVPDTARGSLTSIATEQDRTLFFDFMPLDLGQVAGMKTKFFLYTVPGQVYYNSTRKLVLQGADGITFIGDSDPNRMQDNIESMKNLEENLKDYGIDLRKIPFVIQYNKRDLPGAMAVAELNTKLNPYNAPCFEAVAVRGDGVMATLKGLAKIVIDRLNDDYAPGKGASAVAPSPLRAPAAAAAPGSGRPAAQPVPAAAQPAPRPAQPAARPAPAAVQPASRPVAHPAARPAPAVAQAPTPKAHPVQRPPPAAIHRPPPAAATGAETQKKGGALKWIILVIILAALGGAGWYFLAGPGRAQAEQWFPALKKN